MDIETVNRIFEYLRRRQPVEDRALNSLLRSYLQKSFLLNELDSDLSRRSVSETTLDLLEKLEEIEKPRGSESDTLKRAYCAVAVDCTFNLLKDKLKFFTIVKSLWRGRIELMKNKSGGGLGSDLLWAWKKEIEAAVWDDSLCDSLSKKKLEEIRAEEALRLYVREERDRMLPSFIQSVADEVTNDKGLQEILGIQMEPNETKGAKLVDCDETTIAQSLCSNQTSVLRSSAEADKAQETLGLNSMELPAAVKDPFPDAFPFDKAICCEAGPNKTQVDPSKSSAEVDKAQEAISWASMELDPLPDALHPADGRPNFSSVVVQSSGDKNSVPGPSPRELGKKSARSYELDESIDIPQDDRAVASPKTRMRRRWSVLEEDTLRRGVTQFGRGSWKAILTVNKDVFRGRTEVDLKDKWRNMTRNPVY